MTTPIAINPTTKVDNSCNNWFCCTKKKVKKEVEKTSIKATHVAERVRRDSAQSESTVPNDSRRSSLAEYTVEYDEIHIRVESHQPK